MGTEIHPRAEVRLNGIWRLANQNIPSCRNYITFAALANVRNGYGFAGVPTHDAIPFISEPRGLPDDLSAGLRDVLSLDPYALGDHSFSWVTLREMQEYAKPDVHCTGMCLPDDIIGSGRPKSWCGGVSGPSSEKYVRHDWVESFKDAATTFVEIQQELEWMIDDERGITADDIRLVFGFDS